MELQMSEQALRGRPSILTDQQKQADGSAPMRDIKEAFDAFDTDKDGRLTTTELKTILRAYFVVSNEGQLRSFLAILDKDGSGYVDYEEFEQFILEEGLMSVSSDEMDDDLLAAFKMFDKDGNGSIDVNEFREVMVTLGDRLTAEEAELLMKEADTNGDGKIDYNEFCKHMKKNILG